MTDKTPVSLKQLAKMAGVSTATVSRVINNNGRFSEETRARVLSLIKETGYVPNVAAKALRTRTARAVGLVIPEVMNEFFSHIVAAMGRFFFQNDYALFVCNSDEDPAKNRALIGNLLGGKSVDGLIYIARFPLGEGDSDVPAVCLDRVSPGDEARPSVVSANYQGGCLAAEELLRAGSRNPMVLCEPGNTEILSTIQGRLAGFEDTLRRHGVAWSRKRQILRSPMRVPLARECVAQAVRAGRRFDGLFSTMDEGGIGAILGLEDVGVKVPEEMNVIGFDGIELGEYCRPPLTTVKQDATALAIAGAQMLLDILARRQPENEHVVIPVELVRRGSTRR